MKNQKQIPAIVMMVQICAHMNVPIGSSLYEKAVTDHPEYFTDIIEHRKKMSLVPQHVHDSYMKEMMEVFHKRREHKYGAMGILWYSSNPEKSAEYDLWVKENEPIWEKAEKDIWAKYYKPYGLKKHW